MLYFYHSAGVSRLIKNIVSKNATSPDKLPVVAFKNINPELPLILTKLFKYCLKEKCLIGPLKLSYTLFLRMRVSALACRYIDTLSHNVISKLFESIISKRVIEHPDRNNVISDNQFEFALLDHK